MPFQSIEQAKAADFNTVLDGVALTVDQVNVIATWYDSIKAAGTAENPMAVAVAQFKEKYTKTDAGWQKKQTESAPPVKITFYENESVVIPAELVEVGTLQLLEAEEGGPPVLELVVIKSGFSKNVHSKTRRREYRRYYPAATLAEAVNNPKAAEGWPVYLGESGHDEKATVSKRVGTARTVRYDEGVIRARLPVYEDMDWLVKRLRQDPNMVGPSIEATGRVRLGQVNGIDAAVVEALDVARIKLVESPAAGGSIISIKEAEEEFNKDTEGGATVDKITLMELKEDHPGVYKAACEEAAAEIRESADTKAKDAKLTELTESVKKLEGEKKEFEEAATEAKSKELIDEAMPRDEKTKEHVFPEKARAKLHKELKGEVDEKVIAEAVKDMADFVTELTNAGRPVGMSQKPSDKDKADFEEAEKDLDEMAGGEPDDETEKDKATK